MNLLDKLKPEYKVALAEKMEEFPHMKESIFKCLTEKTWEFELTIKEAGDITMYLADKTFKDIYELFKD